MIYVLFEIEGEYDSYLEEAVAASLNEEKLCRHMFHLKQEASKKHQRIPRFEIRPIEEVK